MIFYYFFIYGGNMKKLCVVLLLLIDNQCKDSLNCLSRFYVGNLEKMWLLDANLVFLSCSLSLSFITWIIFFYYFWADSYFWIDFSPNSYHSPPKFPRHCLFKSQYCLPSHPFSLSCFPSFFLSDSVYKIVRTFFDMITNWLSYLIQCRSIV